MKGGNIDYLIGDYLAELTMSILNRARQRNPKMGFATGWVTDVVKPLCKEIKDKKIKLITNSGGLNPLGRRDALLQVAAAAPHVSRRHSILSNRDGRNAACS